MAVEMIEKMPPQSMEVEVSLLGAMLLDNAVIDTAREYLTKDYFYKTAHQELFHTIVELHDKGQAVDLVLLKEELRRRGTLEKVGGVEYLMELEESVPAVANAEHYARLIRDSAIKRGLIEAAVKIQKEAYENREDLDSLLDKSESLIFDLAQRKFSSSVTHLADLIDDAMTRLEGSDRKGRLTGLSTGFYDVDDMTCGLQPSELIIVAGRPGMGKTSFILNILQHLGVVENVPSLLFSLEVSAQQIAQNMLCSYARLSAHKARKGSISTDEWPKLNVAANAMSQAPIFVDDSSGLSVVELRSKARRHKSKYDIKLVVVDYLQLLEPPRAENRQQEVSIISRGLKSLAKELKVPVIAVSQLNRAVETQEDSKPRMSNLRESGSLEQDADLIMLLHRDEYYNPEKNPGTAEVIIAKQRNGPTGNVNLAFLKEFMRFEPYSREQGL